MPPPAEHKQREISLTHAMQKKQQSTKTQHPVHFLEKKVRKNLCFRSRKIL
jgi:hypothetical protein